MVPLVIFDDKTKAKLEAYGLTSQAAHLSFVAACSSIATVSCIWTYRRYWKRIPNAESVPTKLIARRGWINGVVTSVGDGDNFRLYHTPGLFWRWPIKLRHVPQAAKALQGQTIHIRMAGVDAPEAAHFGKPGQPYAKEALDWLRGTVHGRRVWCQLVRRDQYQRIVGVPYLEPRILPALLFKGRNLSLMMVTAGWGVTYAQAGGEYGAEGKAKYIQLEAQARAARRGMWASKKKLESPAEYKKRVAGDSSAPVPTTVKVPRRKLLSRLFSSSKVK
ncbi:putative endonuclease lcl3 [Tulasnella sp. JGI-2019a]|nr:putative endonuclease lcl3 [Tulasnella sp. JGI-2019a]KAG8994579.1 putative endonuclease lcl3 [Tulasnella sp. JGI-2019a]KAG9031806.1 putative endonuclease lcl3 [Tulasnella sp. JGI-2019a]